MKKVYSIEERIVLIVGEFLDNVKEKEPFVCYLEDYRFRLRAKLVELLATPAFDSALEGMLKCVEAHINKLDLENEKELRRILEAVEKTNELLKEFLEGDRVKDKAMLSKVSGRLGTIAEELRLEINRRCEGLLDRIRKLFGR
ncbi:MAG: hypothetical protein JHC21_05480 [Thermocrinis sp.]|nr:hypothetical protein [Thermocrinis sp.]